MVEVARANRLLAGLPEPEADRLARHLFRTRMPLGRVVQPAHHPVRRLYFPLDCIVTLLYLDEDGSATEIAVVGSEGLTGITAILGGMTSPTHAVVQCSGHALALDAGIVKQFDDNSIFRARLNLFTLAQMTQIAQTAACIRHHTIEQQLTRWLLLSFDRTASATLVATHEVMANMLGVRRVGITEAATNLQHMGVISYHRGNITLVDRAGLERIACACYGVIAAEYRRLLTFEE